jgi:small subunit ribosomal protein S15
MARMHSRKKGKSGSTRPARREKPVWVELSSEQVEKEVVKLARKGVSQSLIGVVLRDSYGIPLVKVVTGKSIHQILKEHDIEAPLPEDLTNLVKKALILRKHLESNHKDLHSKLGLQRTESKIYRLIKYYKGKKVLESDFKYDPEKIRTIVMR